MGRLDAVNMLTRIPVDILQDTKKGEHEMEYKDKVEAINKLSEFEYYHEEYELVNHLESGLISARHLLKMGEKTEAEELLDKILRSY